MAIFSREKLNREKIEDDMRRDLYVCRHCKFNGVFTGESECWNCVSDLK